MNSLHVHTCGGSIIALDELGRRAKWHWWLKSGVSSGGRSSEGVIVVSGVLTYTYIRPKCLDLHTQMKVDFCSVLSPVVSRNSPMCMCVLER